MQYGDTENSQVGGVKSNNALSFSDFITIIFIVCLMIACCCNNGKQKNSEVEQSIGFDMMELDCKGI